MPSTSTSVKIVRAALDEDERTGDIILRGRVDLESLKALRVDKYQREILSQVKINELIKALRMKSVPDIVLGMRGQTCMERSNAFYLQDPVFIIDGLQRTTAALTLLADDTDDVPRLGCKVHFGTTFAWERKELIELNAHQSKVNGNVMLRNLEDDIAAIKHLIRLCSNKAFVLYDQVCWTQKMKRSDLITAVSLVKVTGMLHSHAGPGRSSQVIDLANGLEKIMENVGRNIFLANVRTFFEIVDRCFGIRTVQYRSANPQLRVTFLTELARVFSDHTNFWKEDRLAVDADTIRKLAQFPIGDPNVANLASSGGNAGKILNVMIVDHINSGRRSRRLKPRRSLTDRVEEIVEESNGNGEDSDPEEA